MAIKSNIGVGVISVGTGDTTIYQLTAPTQRYAITESNAHNSAASATTLEVYISPNLTSASGKIVSKMTIPPGQDFDVNAILGLGTIQNVIAKASQAGINMTLSKTEYSEDA
jgi:hypothetical protein